MKILNTEKEDYHIHSLNFSDGFSTIDEIVKFAGEIGMKKIAIVDHSQAGQDADQRKANTYRPIINRWKNIHNKVKVIFGVEADLLNENGDICEHIQGFPGEFIILSYHPYVYSGDKKKVTEGFLKAIEKNQKKINIIGHLGAYPKDIDFIKVVECANKYKIPIEINCQYLIRGENEESWKKILAKSDAVYVNSDAHTLNEIKDMRKIGFKFLKDNGFLKK